MLSFTYRSISRWTGLPVSMFDDKHVLFVCLTAFVGVNMVLVRMLHHNACMFMQVFVSVSVFFLFF